MKPRYRDPNPNLLDYAARQEERWNDGQAAVAAERQPTPNRSTNQKKPVAYDKAALFLKELSCIIRYAGGGGAYHERDGAKYVLAAIPSIGAQCGGFEGLQQHPMQFEAEVIRFRDFLVPGVFDDEIDTMVRDALHDAEQRHSRFLTADQTGTLIGLDAVTRAELRITQIGAIDLPKDARKDLRGVKAKARAQRNRAKHPGYTPRNECKAAWVRAKAIELNRSEKTIRRMLDRGTLAYLETPDNGSDQDSFAADFSRCGANENGSLTEQPGSARVQRDKAVRDEIAAPARIRAGGTVKAVRPSRSVAPPLPGGEAWAQGDLLDDRFPAAAVLKLIAAHLADYAGGPMTSAQRCAVRDLMRHMDLKHGQFGRLIGLSRQQVCNSTRPSGSDGFGSAAAANLRQLLAVAA